MSAPTPRDPAGTPGAGWKHALNAARFSTGDVFGWHEGGSLWSGIVEATDARGCAVKVRDVAPGYVA